VNEAKVGDVLHGRLTLILPKAYEFVSLADYIPAGFELVNFKLSTEDQSLLKGENGQDNGAVGQTSTVKNLAAAGVIDSNPGFFKRTWIRVKEFFTGTKEAPTPTTTTDSSQNFLDEAAQPTMDLQPDINESHDDRLFLFKQHMEPGVYTYDYYIRALVPGTFHHLPARAEEMYFPEVFGRTGGAYFIVKE